MANQETAVTIERFDPTQPHRGKVLAAVQAHADDIPFFCGGTVAKLLAEGYTGYLIQTTNDEKCGPTPSLGETILSNEREVDALARVLGFRKVYNLGYRNHRLDEVSPQEIRGRLIFLYRLLRVDTILTFNPWGQGEENPDHYVTGHVAEEACWMAGMNKDYPEQLDAGLEPHSVQQKYYWVARPGQPYNHIVDIGPFMDLKIAAMSVNKSQGPAGSQGRRLKTRLADQGLRLPLLDGDDEAADRAYIRQFCLDEYRDLGQRYGLDYAEAFYCVPQGAPFTGSDRPGAVDAYVAQYAVPRK
jgi:LmbE family N-acetylglucosaminyl deacetylase